MNISYLLYQAERIRNPWEQREADVRVGERAASFARLLRSLRPVRHQPATYETGEHEAIRQSCVTAAR